ncbi:ABC transporter ATP-binding protein [Natronorubrum tibetense]|uniref:Nickel import system ATP-binding protein NikD n=1 Tax=Natronorubrum tibetense GA33 TaxID=1114856 RepID=L9W168_9EURY|nr:ABC transporter ATP-binding protein [Natronorubrum tibetense]ELY43021.1 oligopeptide/dipeptide ABC transporter ATPase [Natronorubrum tibetense GA33]
MSLQQSHSERSADRDAPIIEVRNLQTAFFTEKETIRAVDGISFDIRAGETVGIVGESGSGKSVTARSIMRLVDSPGHILEGSSVRYNHLEAVREYADTFGARTVDLSDLERQYDPAELVSRGEVDIVPAELGYEDASEVSLADIVAAGYVDDLGIVDEGDCVFVRYDDPDNPETITDGFVEITRLSGEAERKMRGGRIAMVFQDPLTSLNPVYTVGNQIKESLRLHQGLTGSEATQEAAELLEAVGISDARRRVNEYPHQFSGGMRQRAVIAMTLACDPDLLICDEPTTALDVTIQAQILELLEDLQRERDLSMMFITHDMGVIAEIAHRVNVMYAGQVVETADVEDLFTQPEHPYTRGLLRSIPGQQSDDRLETIEGNVPTPNAPATSCRFAPRCPEAFDACEQVNPVPVPVDDERDNHTAACLLCPKHRSAEKAVRVHQQRSARHDGGESQ